MKTINRILSNTERITIGILGACLGVDALLILNIGTLAYRWPIVLSCIAGFTMLAIVVIDVIWSLKQAAREENIRLLTGKN